MKLSELKIGDKITHYCSGFIVEGTVKEKISPTHIISEHSPVMYGRDEIKETAILESSYLQKKWGGTDKNGQPSKGKDVTPGAWYNGEEITI